MLSGELEEGECICDKFIKLHCTALHCTALQCNALHCTAQRIFFHRVPYIDLQGLKNIVIGWTEIEVSTLQLQLWL